MKRHIYVLCVLPVLLLLAGCPAATLSELDSRFLEISELKTTYINQQDHLYIVPDTVYNGFAELAKSARAEVDEVGADKPLLRVGFFRVAVMSAWQAGPKAKEFFLGYVSEARAACNSLPQKYQDAPRDCMMIELSKPLAAQDSAVRKIRKLQVDHGTDASKYPSAVLGGIDGVFETSKDAFSEIKALKSTYFKNAGFPERFIEAVEKQQCTTFCSAYYSSALYRNAMVQGDETQTNRQKQMKAALDEISRQSNKTYSAEKCINSYISQERIKFSGCQ